MKDWEVHPLIGFIYRVYFMFRLFKRIQVFKQFDGATDKFNIKPKIITNGIKMEIPPKTLNRISHIGVKKEPFDFDFKLEN